MGKHYFYIGRQYFPYNCTHQLLLLVAMVVFLFKTDVDRDTISSLGGHNNTQLLSVIKACPSSHS